MGRQIESALQRECVKWFRIQWSRYRTLLFAVPNGGVRNSTDAAMLIGEGVVPGVADLILLLPDGESHALCLEMKTGKGRQSDHQKAWQAAVEAAGYRYEVCRSLDDFRRVVNEHIGRHERIRHTEGD